MSTEPSQDTSSDDTELDSEVDEVYEPPAEESEAEGPQHNTIHIRNLSIKCGHCHTYQTLCSFSRNEEWNVYTYECENDICDPETTRTLVEVPAELDEFARRDPGWRGGRKHAGAG